MEYTMADFRADVANMWKSWVVWFNGLVGLAAVALMDNDVKALLTEHFTPAQMKVMVGLIAFLNIALRFKTNGSLRDK